MHGTAELTVPTPSWRTRRGRVTVDALEALLDRHPDRLHAVCRRICGPARRARRHAGRVDRDRPRRSTRFDGRAAFTTWSHRIAANAALDELRRARRRGVPAVGRARPRRSPGTRGPWTGPRARPDWRSTPRWPHSPTSSAPRSCCATSPTSSTPRSRRCSRCRSARCGPASPRGRAGARRRTREPRRHSHRPSERPCLNPPTSISTARSAPTSTATCPPGARPRTATSTP